MPRTLGGQHRRLGWVLGGFALGALAACIWELRSDSKTKPHGDPVSTDIETEPKALPGLDEVPNEQRNATTASGRTVTSAAFLVGAMAIFALMVSSLVFGYRIYRSATATPEPRKDPGEVRIYFDRPGIEAFMEVRFDHYSEDFTGSRYFIRVSSEYKPSEVGFLLVATGDSRASERYPGGGERDRVSGCWDSIGAFFDLEPKCFSAQLPRDPGYSTPEAMVPSQGIEGTIRRRKGGEMITEVWLHSDTSYAEESGKRTYFALPRVGTSYIPKGYRDKVPFYPSKTIRTYVPERLDVTILYRDLMPNDRVENVAPTLLLADELAWHESDTSLLAPRGSIVDTVAEERAQAYIFVAGIVVAILPVEGSILLWTLKGSVRSIRSRPRGKRS